MASKSMFRSKDRKAKGSPAADTVNQAGGKAYTLEAKAALAQLAFTGCFNQTFYCKPEDQLAKVKELVAKVDPDYVGAVATLAREKGFMKDMPAFLVAWLSGQVTQAHHKEELLLQQRATYVASKREAPETLQGAILAAGAEVQRLNAIVWETFPRVIDNGKMLKNYVQIVRSGEAGRKSLGSGPKRLIRSWFDTRTDEQVFYQSVGNDPSLGDVVALIHPRPMTQSRAALFGYLRGKTLGKFEDKDFVVTDALPEAVAAYERFKKDGKGPIPKAPFEMLEGLPLSVEQWKELALVQSWQSTRQRLNTFLRKGVFGKGAGSWDMEVIKAVADKLRDEKAILKARAMPYQVFVAYLNMGPEMPIEITNALQDAAEIATRNIPKVDGAVVILPDVSGSMHSSVTGMQFNQKTGKAETHSSKVRCIDVAALVAASFLRTNPHTTIIPFESKAITGFKLNPRDSIMTNAEKLRNLPAGGTNCGAAMAAINKLGIDPALVMYVSDNESWVDSPHYGRYSGTHYGSQNPSDARTFTLSEWEKVKKRSPNAKLVCLDIQPGDTTQAPARADILNIGGFSDQVFEVTNSFLTGSTSSWVEMIEKGV